MINPTRKWPAIALAALGLTLAAPAAQAAGVPLANNQGCALQFYQTDMTGALIAKSRGVAGSSYRLTVFRSAHRSGVIADVSGAINSRGPQEIELARVQLSQRDFVRRERGQAMPGRYINSIDMPEMDASLEIFDAAGRRTCASRGYDVFPTAALFSSEPRVPQGAYATPHTQQRRFTPAPPATARMTPPRGGRQDY